ncbi:hypothetical protein WR25_02769 [Diploscapter pachys]|uniref:Apple domain-containing protein n=1 Tax=Diploscapter pachys TaxID=2018661 RepID=A0A2A2L5Z3_9BILA|nr:hypothetical protein WR25_02769 [Diploscapter pachys]
MFATDIAAHNWKLSPVATQFEAPQLDVPTADHEKLAAKPEPQQEDKLGLKPPLPVEAEQSNLLAAALEQTIQETKSEGHAEESATSQTVTVEADVPVVERTANGKVPVEVLPIIPDCPVGENARVQIIDGVEIDSPAPIAFTVATPERCVQICRSNSLPNGARLSLLCRSAHFERLTGRCHLYSDALNPNGYLEYKPNAQVLYMEKICIADNVLPVSCDDVFRRIPQHILFGHATDIVTTASELECIRECVEAKKNRHIDCRSLVFYPDFPSYNCILNIHTRASRPAFFVPEHVYRVDYIEIAPCASLPIAQLVQGPAITVRSEDSLLQRVENQKGGLGIGVGTVTSDWSEWRSCDKKKKVRHRERICESCKDNIQIETCTVQDTIDDAINKFLKEQSKGESEPSMVPSRQVFRKPVIRASLRHIPFPQEKIYRMSQKSRNSQFFGPPFNKDLPETARYPPSNANSFRYR